MFIKLRENHIHIWTGRIKKSLQYSFIGLENLPQDKKEQIEKIKGSDRKNEILVGQNHLKSLIFFYKGQREFFITNGVNGKPEINIDKFYFNLSHSKELICYGLSINNLGIDIEPENRNISHAISKKLLQNTYDKNTLSLVQVWTIKEAFLKFLGTGISTPIEEIEIISNELITYKNKNYYYKSSLYKNHFISIVSDQNFTYEIIGTML